MDQSNNLTRRDFVKTAGTAAVASILLPESSFATLNTSAKRRYAIIGTGERSVGMWARPLVQNYTDVLDIVGMCDINSKRVAV
ncbi:MAG TPA: twin-arginine translocation signal domain-containing protein, partial [Pyrinomonadaceae bacterium]|nr:twin-arginine translocation signal domain-containing protein [Pyrinomonadaceae bacterium]